MFASVSQPQVNFGPGGCRPGGVPSPASSAAYPGGALHLPPAQRQLRGLRPPRRADGCQRLRGYFSRDSQATRVSVTGQSCQRPMAPLTEPHLRQQLGLISLPPLLVSMLLMKARALQPSTRSITSQNCSSVACWSRDEGRFIEAHHLPGDGCEYGYTGSLSPDRTGVRSSLISRS
jgi:hypothetical protein